MLLRLKQFAFTCKNKIYNFAGFCKLYRISFHKIESGKLLIVRIENLNHGRYGFQLINYFHQAGYYIVFYKSRSFLLNLHMYDKLIFKLSDIALFNKRMAINTQIDFLCFVKTQNVNCPLKYRRRFDLNLDYFNSQANSPSDLRLPFYIHPIMNNYFPPMNVIRKKNRILFYAQDDAVYDSEIIQTKFNLLTRRHVFRQIQKSGINLIDPGNYTELESYLNDDSIEDAFFLLDSSRVWVPADQWVEVLSSFDFFLATPGVSMPHSHNCIEAMCAGVIPILQYANWFFPALQNGVNCIAFNNNEELLQQIDSIMTMQKENIECMRANVTEYYAQHINPSSVIQKIENMPGSHISVFFNAEELSIKC
jgi:hypothetical protein